MFHPPVLDYSLFKKAVNDMMKQCIEKPIPPEKRTFVIFGRTGILFLMLFMLSLLIEWSPVFAQETDSDKQSPAPIQRIPGTTVLKGEVGDAELKVVNRYFQDPFLSLPWLRADLSLELDRIFTNYSGDISGRYLEMASIVSGGDTTMFPNYFELLNEIPGLQRADGHFGEPVIDWDKPADLDLDIGRAKYLPTLWGNSRIMCGLVEAYKVTHNPKLLESAERLFRFYQKLTEHLTDPEQVAGFTGISVEKIREHLPDSDGRNITVIDGYDATFAGGYVTCYFPIIEGLVKLYQITGNKEQLELAERIADFYRIFDVLNTTHAHGMLCCYYGFLLLYQETGRQEYLDRAIERWNAMIDGGYVNALGGIPEGIRLLFNRDEGCAESDWLRFNLKLFEITQNVKYLAIIDRLIHNHYRINQWNSGCFGHRDLFCDTRGTCGIDRCVHEAVWCCIYHGTLGFHYLKQWLCSLNPDLLSVYFAMDFESEPEPGVKLESSLLPGRYDFDLKPLNLTTEVILTQKLETTSDLNRRVAVRVPDWCDRIRIKDLEDNLLKSQCENGYCITQNSVNLKNGVKVEYLGGIVVEDRMMNRVDISNIPAGGSLDVVFRYGPYVLMVNNIRHVPSVSVNGDFSIRKLEESGLEMDAVVPGETSGRKIHLEKFASGQDNGFGCFVIRLVNGDVEPDKMYRIISEGLSLALGVSEVNRENNYANVELADGTGLRWLVERIDDMRIIRLVDEKTGKLVSESGDGDPLAGRNVHLWEDVGSLAQEWELIPVEEHVYKLRNLRSGFFLTADPEKSEFTTNINVRVAPENNLPSQNWRFEE